MVWSDFTLPALITSFSIGATFFDGKIIKSKVMHELSSASGLTDPQKENIAEMCGGASTLMSFIAGIGLIFGNAILSLRLLNHLSLVVDISALGLMILLLHAIRVATLSRLSDIDEVITVIGVSRGTIFRVELVILNLVVLFGLVYGIDISKSGH